MRGPAITTAALLGQGLMRHRAMAWNVWWRDGSLFSTGRSFDETDSDAPLRCDESLADPYRRFLPCCINVAARADAVTVVRSGIATRAGVPRSLDHAITCMATLRLGVPMRRCSAK